MTRNEGRQDSGKQVAYWSTPPKIDFNRKSQSKFMSDA